jgi:hypothetical protein
VTNSATRLKSFYPLKKTETVMAAFLVMVGLAKAVVQLSTLGGCEYDHPNNYIYLVRFGLST